MPFVPRSTVWLANIRGPLAAVSQVRPLFLTLYYLSDRSYAYAGRRASPGLTSLVVTMRRLASSTPVQNTIQPNVLMIQKLPSNPKARARVPATPFNKSPTRIRTLAPNRLIACIPATLDWRRASFHPQYTATPTTANTPSTFRIGMIASAAPDSRITVPDVPAIWLRWDILSGDMEISTIASMLSTLKTIRLMRVTRALATSAMLPRPNQADISMAPRKQ